jgi:hypothetical protein
MPADADVRRVPPRDVVDFRDELHPGVKRGQWWFQRAVWVLLALLMVFALLGFFGNGCFSRRTVSSSDGGAAVEVSYPRWTRMKAPQQISVEVRSPAATGALTITVSQAFLDVVRVNAFEPQPESVAMSAEGPTYTWPVDDWSQPVTVAVQYEPLQWRTVEGEILVEAGEGASPQRLRFTQIVFP